MSRHQTLSFLTRRFREAGIRPNTRHGQNFLVDVNLQHLLVETAELSPTDVVLEVGTGTGALTALIAEQAAGVVTVEIDRHLYELASDELLPLKNVTMLRQDVLANKNRIDDRIWDAVAEVRQRTGAARWKLLANLPFNVATPIVSNVLARDDAPTTMTVTIQKELADRIVARPSTKDYGSLSLWLQSQCRTEVVRTLGPTVFWPRPKVHSAIIHIRVDPQLREQIPDRAYWHHFVRAIFMHRRKFLRSVLVGVCKSHLGKPDVDAVLAEMKLGPTTRAEELNLESMLALCESVRRRAPQWRL